MAEVEKNWFERTARSLADRAELDVDDPELYQAILLALEVAGEMKTVRLKVLLGRCQEIIRQSVDHDQAASVNDKDLYVKIEAELK